MQFSFPIRLRYAQESHPTKSSKEHRRSGSLSASLHGRSMTMQNPSAQSRLRNPLILRTEITLRSPTIEVEKLLPRTLLPRPFTLSHTASTGIALQAVPQGAPREGEMSGSFNKASTSPKKHRLRVCLMWVISYIEVFDPSQEKFQSSEKFASASAPQLSRNLYQVASIWHQCWNMCFKMSNRLPILLLIIGGLLLTKNKKRNGLKHN